MPLFEESTPLCFSAFFWPLALTYTYFVCSRLTDPIMDGWSDATEEHDIPPSLASIGASGVVVVIAFGGALGCSYLAEMLCQVAAALLS